MLTRSSAFSPRAEDCAAKRIIATGLRRGSWRQLRDQPRRRGRRSRVGAAAQSAVFLENMQMIERTADQRLKMALLQIHILGRVDTGLRPLRAMVPNARCRNP